MTISGQEFYTFPPLRQREEPTWPKPGQASLQGAPADRDKVESMQVIRARSAGFCIGVSLALRRLDKELDDFTARQQTIEAAGANRPMGLYTLGPIIHNPLVMEAYKKQGVICESDPCRFRPGDKVVIRAHGIPPAVERQLEDCGATVIDATCPKVKKAQLAIGKEQAKGGALLLFGEKDHPEVRGLLGYAGHNALVFGNMEELRKLPLAPGPSYFLAAQTTQERNLFLEALDYLEKRLGHSVTCLDTICDATRDRQQEVLKLAEMVEAMVVVGGLNSGNTRRLAEAAAGKGIPTIHVEQVADITHKIEKDVLYGKKVVGLTAGASTPEEHINEMQIFLERL